MPRPNITSYVSSRRHSVHFVSILRHMFPPTLRHIDRPRHDVTRQDAASVMEFVKRRLLYASCAFVLIQTTPRNHPRADETRTTGYYIDPHSFEPLERTPNAKCLRKHVTQ